MDVQKKNEHVQVSQTCVHLSLSGLVFFCSAHGPRGLDLDARLRPPWRDTQCKAVTKKTSFLCLESRECPPRNLAWGHELSWIVYCALPFSHSNRMYPLFGCLFF